MKIVIDIPDELYNSVLNETYCGNLYEELKNGIVLPKGHGRLIDADALDNSILQTGFAYAITRRKLRYTGGDVRGMIANADTIIPADREVSE